MKKLLILPVLTAMLFLTTAFSTVEAAAINSGPCMSSYYKLNDADLTVDDDKEKWLYLNYSYFADNTNCEVVDYLGSSGTLSSVASYYKFAKVDYKITFFRVNNGYQHVFLYGPSYSELIYDTYDCDSKNKENPCYGTGSSDIFDSYIFTTSSVYFLLDASGFAGDEWVLQSLEVRVNFFNDEVS